MDIGRLGPRSQCIIRQKTKNMCLAEPHKTRGRVHSKNLATGYEEMEFLVLLERLSCMATMVLKYKVETLSFSVAFI